MHFDLVDQILDVSDDRIVTIKNVTSAEEYLQDHFPSFPVLPGVLMIEALVQAARRLLSQRDPACARHVLGEVKALKYGSFVRPGDSLRIEVTLIKSLDDGSYSFKGVGIAQRPDQAPSETAQSSVSGRFSLRPVSFGPEWQSG